MLLRLIDFIDMNTKGFHTATSWEVALDENFTQIIDSSYQDTVNLDKWITPLPEINGNSFYADLDIVYARIKVWIDNNESEWYTLIPKTQNYQPVKMRDADGTITETTSTELNMN